MVHLDHVSMSVTDLEKSTKWYSDVFGFEKVESGVYPDGIPWAIVAYNDSMIAMSELPQWTAPRSVTGTHRIYHFGLRVNNAEEWIAKIKRFNVKVDHEAAYPRSHSWYVIDPSGYQIEVSYAGGEPLKFK